MELDYAELIAKTQSIMDTLDDLARQTLELKNKAAKYGEELQDKMMKEFEAALTEVYDAIESTRATAKRYTEGKNQGARDLKTLEDTIAKKVSSI